MLARGYSTLPTHYNNNITLKFLKKKTSLPGMLTNARACGFILLHTLKLQQQQKLSKNILKF